ncbi:hypothetical protein E2562_034116 [Oryza meyeriana var. granulata]|uniref:Uncharacterized protein n=1 Tax=Oryza meyeriana var. granulata TaxID=110450 RepID=A0A6G1E6C1_9ORYZ|nr:hypothetical protein E2562_034116 [Oryza meyeriana var. granulata]
MDSINGCSGVGAVRAQPPQGTGRCRGDGGAGAVQDDTVVTIGQVLGIEPAVKFRNPATDSKVALGLRVLDGCCLLCRDCAAVAHQYNAVKVHSPPVLP